MGTIKKYDMSLRIFYKADLKSKFKVQFNDENAQIQMHPVWFSICL